MTDYQSANEPDACFGEDERAKHLRRARVRREQRLYRVARTLVIVIPVAGWTVAFVSWPRGTGIVSIALVFMAAFGWAVVQLASGRPID